MANIIENNIKVIGNAVDVAKIKALVINHKNEVDLSIAVPMPQAIKGVLGDSSGTTFKLNKVIDNRIGSLTPVEFMKECESRFKETGNPAYNIKNFDEKMASSVYFDRMSSIERTIESYMAAFIEREKSQSMDDWLFEYNSFAPKVRAVMETENALYCIEHHQVSDNAKWAKWHWGCKFNALDTHDVLDNFQTQKTHSDTEFEYYFNTINGNANSWFESLLPLIQDVKDAEVIYTWGDSGALCGGMMERCDDGELIGRELEESEWRDFLNIEDDE